jgi:hypothetical protein
MDNLALSTIDDLVSSSDPVWNSLYRDWVCRQALSHANEQFGPMHKALTEDGIVEMQLRDQFGKGWRASAEALEIYAPSYERTTAAEEAIARDYFDPQTAAAINLTMHPAPNLPAALVKMEVIKREELHNYLPMPRDPWEIVAEDFARLQGEA